MSFYNNISDFRVLHYDDNYQLIDIGEVVWNHDKTKLLRCVQYSEDLPIISGGYTLNEHCERCACAPKGTCFACESSYNGEECVLVPVENSEDFCKKI